MDFRPLDDSLSFRYQATAADAKSPVQASTNGKRVVDAAGTAQRRAPASSGEANMAGGTAVASLQSQRMTEA